MDDLIFTHLSARIPGKEGVSCSFPFGMLFDEVTASNLLEVDIEGTAIGSNSKVNPAGWIVHRVVYEAVPEAQSVMHLHTITGTAVSAQRQGLLPVNQFGVTFAARSLTTTTTGLVCAPRSRRSSSPISATNG